MSNVAPFDFTKFKLTNYLDTGITYFVVIIIFLKKTRVLSVNFQIQPKIVIFDKFYSLKLPLE